MVTAGARRSASGPHAPAVLRCASRCCGIVAVERACSVAVRGIIIGAGRGRRLMPTTADAPKCFAEIGGQRIIDVILSALRKGGVDPIGFIGGYRIEAVQAAYPELEFVENPRWAETNILGSLMCAEAWMGQGFVSSYA